MKLTFETVGSLGDWLCLISAAREYARRHPMDEVCVANLDDVVSLYRDGLIKPGRGGRRVAINAEHREKYFSVRRNYLGTFLWEIVPQIKHPLNLDLPKFPELSKDRIAIIQPRSRFAENPPVSYVQGLVNEFLKCGGTRLFAVGDLSTPRDLEGVDYSLLCDSVPELLRNVSRAYAVLTPRSATAHAAAAYGIPTFAWVPDDGENWHLDYPNWQRFIHYFKLGRADGIDSLRCFLESTRIAGRIESEATEKTALVTINIGNVLKENARESFIDSARRWNCEYREITALPPGAELPAYTKFWLFDLVDADRIFYIDADAVIRNDTPNPFTEFPDLETLYAVKDPCPFDNLQLEAERAQASLAFSLDVDRYFNSGVLILSRSAHAALLLELREIQGGWIWWDQTPLNIMAQRHKLSLIPPEWNDVWPADVNEMASFIYHYAANPGRESQLPHVKWRKV